MFAAIRFSFYRATPCIRAAYAVVRCLSVRLSVTFVYCVNTNNRILKLFLPSVTHNILVFSILNLWQYSDGGSTNYLAFGLMSGGVSSIIYRWVIYSTKRRRPFIAQTVTTKHHATVNLVYDSKPRRLRRREQNRTEFNCTQLVNLKPK